MTPTLNPPALLPVIEPCPFCGSKCRVLTGHAIPQVWDHGAFSRVFCTKCQVRQHFHRNDDEAIAAWNTRQAPAEPKVSREAVVVPLKWSEPHPSHSYPNWHAMVAAVRFEARIDTSKPLIYGKFPLSISGAMVVEKFDTLEAAKAHAQAVFEERILSCLAVSNPPADGSPVAYAPKGHIKRYLKGKNTACWVYGSPTAEDDDALYLNPPADGDGPADKMLAGLHEALGHAQGFRAGVEAAAKVAEIYGVPGGYMRDAGKDIATCIRALAPPSAPLGAGGEG